MNEAELKQRYQEEYQIKSQLASSIGGTHRDELNEKPFSEFESLYSCLQKEVSRANSEVNEIYFSLDRLIGIPKSEQDKVRPERDNEQARIIPKLQEEINSLHDINNVLEIIRKHLNQLIG